MMESNRKTCGNEKKNKESLVICTVISDKQGFITAAMYERSHDNRIHINIKPYSEHNLTSLP